MASARRLVGSSRFLGSLTVALLKQFDDLQKDTTHLTWSTFMFTTAQLVKCSWIIKWITETTNCKSVSGEINLPQLLHETHMPVESWHLDEERNAYEAESMY